MLTVTVLGLVAFAATLLENDNLLTFNERGDNFGSNLSTRYGGSADGDSTTAIVNEEDLVELYNITLILLGQVVNEELRVLLYFELLTSNFYNCVHFN